MNIYLIIIAWKYSRTSTIFRLSKESFTSDDRCNRKIRKIISIANYISMDKVILSGNINTAVRLKLLQCCMDV